MTCSADRSARMSDLGPDGDPPAMSTPSPTPPGAPSSAEASNTLATSLRRPRTLQILLVLLAVGSIGPWVTFDLFGGGLSRGGTEDGGDGILTLIGAGLIAAAMYAPVRGGGRSRLRAPVIVLTLATCVFVVVYDFIDVNGTELVSVGWGLWLALLATLALVPTVKAQWHRIPGRSAHVDGETQP